jgi:RNA 2',3'-cyclic 3'-phosphodiesterase
MSDPTGCDLPERLRVFVALVAPERAVTQLQAAQAKLNEAAQSGQVALRLTPSHQFHMTLAFLGEISAAQVQPVIVAASDAARTQRGWTLAPRTFVALPSAKRMRVIAVSFEDATGEFSQFVLSLHAALRNCGCSIEERAFHAHITVARLRAPRRVPLEGLDVTSTIEPFFTREIAVVQSILSSKGSEYRRLAAYSLGGGGTLRSQTELVG